MRLASVRSTEIRSGTISEAEFLGMYQARYGQKTAGVSVTPDTAMRISSCWRAVNYLVDLTCGPAWYAYKMRSDGTSERLKVQPRILTNPSPVVPADVWRKQLGYGVMIGGNSIGKVIHRDSTGWPDQVVLARPESITCRQPDGQFSPPVYTINRQPVVSDDILHVRNWVMPGSVTGLSPITNFATTIGVAIATQNYGADFFGDGGQPQGIITSEQYVHPLRLREAKELFREGTRGDKLVALGQGWKYNRISLSPAEVMFLEVIAATDALIARIYGLPPSKIGAAPQGTGTLTYANRADDTLSLLADTVVWIMGVFESAMSRMLPAGQFVLVDETQMLRLDPVTIAKIQDLRIRNGTMTPNEGRAQWNETPLPNGQGDEALWPPYSTTPAPAPGSDTPPPNGKTPINGSSSTP